MAQEIGSLWNWKFGCMCAYYMKPWQCRAGDATLTPVNLCECQQATGEPHGLSCDKEGWFISSFEYVGSWVSVLWTHP